MTQFTNTPPFVEEIVLPEEINIEQLLAQFKLLVPTNFVQLETKGNNHMCSTTGWKEPVCERYMFFNDVGQLLQLDIPHALLNKLKLKEKENIPYPVYVSPQVLKKEEICKGITIENENEIFIQKPLTVHNLEKELNKWLDEVNNLRHQTNQLNHNDQLNYQTITNLQLEVARLEQQKQDLTIELKGEKQLSQSQKSTCHTRIQSLQSKLHEKENKMIDLEKEKKELEIKFEEEIISKEKEKSELVDKMDRKKEEWEFRHFIILLVENKSLVLRKLTFKEMNLEFLSCSLRGLEISDCKDLSELRLPSGIEGGLFINDCPNLKEIKIPVGVSLVNLKSNLKFTESLDITEWQIGSDSKLSFGNIKNPNKDFLIIECKIIFTKSQRNKKFCSLIGHHKGHYYSDSSHSYVSLDLLIETGILPNYEEKLNYEE